MPYCAVLECKNDSRAKNISKGGISYHRFPKSPVIKEKWIEATGRQNWFPSKTSTICSEHFLDSDFIIKKKGNKYIDEAAIPRRKFVCFRTGESDVVESNEIIKIEAGSSSLETSVMQHKRKINIEALAQCDSKKVPLDTNSAAAAPRKKRLQSLLRGTKVEIKKEILKINQSKARIFRLKNKVNKIVDILKTIQE